MLLYNCITILQIDVDVSQTSLLRFDLVSAKSSFISIQDNGPVKIILCKYSLNIVTLCA